LSVLRKSGDAMTLEALFWVILALGTLVFVPIMMIWSIIDYRRGRGSERRGGGGTISAGIGAAMQELDRIMARPSVEHQVEVEHQTLKREDDSGGDL
jgi:inner membrane protein involved in colicin E2 resistance